MFRRKGKGIFAQSAVVAQVPQDVPHTAVPVRCCRYGTDMTLLGGLRVPLNHVQNGLSAGWFRPSTR